MKKINNDKRVMRGEGAPVLSSIGKDVILNGDPSGPSILESVTEIIVYILRVFAANF